MSDCLTVLLFVPFTELLDLGGILKSIHEFCCVLRIWEQLYWVNPAWASSVDGDLQDSREQDRLSEVLPDVYTLAALCI